MGILSMIFGKPKVSTTTVPQYPEQLQELAGLLGQIAPSLLTQPQVPYLGQRNAYLSPLNQMAIGRAYETGTAADGPVPLTYGGPMPQQRGPIPQTQPFMSTPNRPPIPQDAMQSQPQPMNPGQGALQQMDRQLAPLPAHGGYPVGGYQGDVRPRHTQQMPSGSMGPTATFQSWKHTHPGQDYRPQQPPAPPSRPAPASNANPYAFLDAR